MQGVPNHYKAWWGYRGTWKEFKIKPKWWKFSFKAGKHRRGGIGGLKPKTRIRWQIDAIQDVIKLKNKYGKIRYQTHLYGTKYLRKVYKYKKI